MGSTLHWHGATGRYTNHVGPCQTVIFDFLIGLPACQIQVLDHPPEVQIPPLFRVFTPPPGVYRPPFVPPSEYTYSRHPGGPKQPFLAFLAKNGRKPAGFRPKMTEMAKNDGF